MDKATLGRDEMSLDADAFPPHQSAHTQRQASKERKQNTKTTKMG